jgi:alanine dehydrogenase
MFLEDQDAQRLKKGALIVDISCDEGMSFPFARPTTFDDPMFQVGHLHYYAVDHTPSYLWNSASWEISSSLLPYLPLIMAGPERWEQSETLRRAIEIQDGVIKNPKILSFQNRKAAYPHENMDQRGHLRRKVRL